MGTVTPHLGGERVAGRADVRSILPAVWLSLSLLGLPLFPLTRVPTRRGSRAALEGRGLRSWVVCALIPSPSHHMADGPGASLEFAASLALKCSVDLCMSI